MVGGMSKALVIVPTYNERENVAAVAAALFAADSSVHLLFVDDSPVNIEAAHRLGFDVHAFDDPAALRPALESRGLL